MPRPKFDYGDIVRVKSGITFWFDVPIRRTSGPRIGERASVYAVTADRADNERPEFPNGVLYGVEFEGGDAIEVHEADLELVESSETA